MYAVLIEVDVTEVDRDQGLTALRDQIVPAIKAMPPSPVVYEAAGAAEARSSARW